MAIPLRVLIVEDSVNDTELLVRELRRGGYEPAYERVETPETMSAALDRQVWDIVFGDYSMPHFNGVAALKLLRERGLDLPFIFVSGTIGEDTAVASMKAGANDYVIKGNLKRLLPAVDRELKEAAVRREHRQAEETIRYLAYYDPLTGLPNRTSLLDRLQRTITEGSASKNPVALLLMDLDHFKEVNDTLGHHRGDILLQQVGSRLQAALRPSDLVARLGGDEFAVMLPLAASQHAAQVAQKILNVLEPPFVIEDLPVAVEAGIGIALCPDHGADPNILMQRADVAMYAAKAAGSGYILYDTQHDRHSPRRLSLIGELRQAIDRDQLFLHYQPKIDLRTRRVTGVEALVRWRHPEHGFIPPDQFIEPAERTGLIKPLTLWIFNTAQRQQAAWERDGINLLMSVNLSTRNLHDPHFPDQISEILQPTRGKADRLELEITESAIMNDPARALEAITRLRTMGIRFAIDDFGIGYSSLAYLKRLPVDAIKIDKSFVINMIENQNDAVIVRSTIDLAHNLGLQVIAEGVENKELWDRLAALGCDAAQGYYMAKPIPADDCTRWLRESPWGLRPTASGEVG
ncbi:MAG TPA: EAL domain-containing protein [Nitrospiria bacterium]|jgi:diguanylate cyclase (GGDEF)-like protein|nr:EAL domain-containing protein [Nitrospiria bacterium]